MANFDCKCQKCQETIEFNGIKVEDLPKKHQGCGGILTRLWGFSTKVKATFETVGSFADRQASKLSDDAKEHMRQQQKTQKDSDLPGYRTNSPEWQQLKDYKV